MSSVVSMPQVVNQDLKKTFENIKKANSNRASAIFPAYLGLDQDTYIVFLNYWEIKNKSDLSNMNFSLTLRDEAGQLIDRQTIENIKSHNEISVKGLGLSKTLDLSLGFQGSVELNIISVKNIRFSFPAVIVAYRSGDLVSCVHTAGRIKNYDEVQNTSYSEETNWNCKIGKDVTPFFHYFIGPSVPKSTELEATLRHPDGIPIKTVSLNIRDMSAFSSRTYFCDELFGAENFVPDAFVSVKVEHNSVYPRLVVGNYFKNKKFFEVTHSYPYITENDYCPNEEATDFQSVICGFSSKELALSMRSYPTFCDTEMSVDVYQQEFGQDLLQQSNKQPLIANVSKFLSGAGTVSLEEEDEFLAICLRGEKVPTRMTMSYQFSVKNIKSPFSTDISDGAKACLFPPKHSFWGHGAIGRNFDTCIFLRNKSHTPKKTEASKGILTVFGDQFEEKYEIDIGAETMRSIQISDLLRSRKIQLPSEIKFVSWFLNMNQPTCDTFFIGYDKVSGNTFGDHGF